MDPPAVLRHLLALAVLALNVACTAMVPAAAPVAPPPADLALVPAAGDPTATAAPTAPPRPARPTPTAAPAPGPTATPRPAARPLEQFRAYWVDAFHDGFKTPAQVEELLRAVRAANLNAVVVQVRRRGDAYYNRSSEPRAEDPDLAPGFDALQALIEAAHRFDPPIEVHAWLATFPVWRGRDGAPRDPAHVFNAHGRDAAGRDDWLARNVSGAAFDGSNYSLDPGHPDALRYTVDVYLNVVRNYDVDGIHLDYVRYADRDWGYNPTSLERFRAQTGFRGTPEPTDPAWAQWRRDQVTALVRQVYLRAIALKPHVKVSAALIAWGDAPARPADWARSAAFARTYQDWRAWLEEGILDLGVPMAYFEERAHPDWFDRWTAFAREQRGKRQVALGIGVFQNRLAASVAQIERALAPAPTGARLDGAVLFAYGQPGVDPGATAFDLAQLLAGPSPGGPFQRPAVPPPMPWKTAPTTGHLMGVLRAADGGALDGATVALSGPRAATARTDGTGFYGLVDLPPGDYQLVARAGGRLVGSGAVRVEPGRVAELDLIATP